MAAVREMSVARLEESWACFDSTPEKVYLRCNLAQHGTLKVVLEMLIRAAHVDFPQPKMTMLKPHGATSLRITSVVTLLTY